MNEHSFVKSVNTALAKQYGDSVMRWKINDDYAGGVPDAWYRGHAGSLFIEYKYVKSLPKRDTTVIKPNLSGLQKVWLQRAERLGQKTAVVVGSPDGHYIFEGLSWQDGVDKTSYLTKSKKTKDIASWINKSVSISAGENTYAK